MSDAGDQPGFVMAGRGVESDLTHLAALSQFATTCRPR